MANLPTIQFDKYYTHAPLTAYLQAVAAARPELCRLHNLYTTDGGLEEWLIEITDFSTGPSEDKPAYLVHANLHAVEVSGTTASLCLIEKLLSDPAALKLLGKVAFYIIPRLNPDGAEYCLTTGGTVRSKAQYRPVRNGLLPQDINGDGHILHMRWQDPYGAYKLDDVDPRILVPRESGDKGPFYSQTTEGIIEDYDGGPLQWGLRSLDFNRNWAYNWQPEHIQGGAGDYAFSNPEMRALADFVHAHPGIFGMLGFHNGCNSVLRPSATLPDEDLDARDVHAMQELGLLGEELTGFRLRPVRFYKGDDDPPISLKGHFTDWGYSNLGLIVFEIELGNSYNAAGITTEDYFAADSLTRQVDFVRQIMASLDKTAPGEAFTPWEKFPHPQLGEVEIGGLHSVHHACPPARELGVIGPNCADFIFQHASRHPELTLAEVEVTRLEGSVYRVRAAVANEGVLPTSVTEQGLKLGSHRPVRVRLAGEEEVEVLSQQTLFEIPNLAGEGGHERLEWFVRAAAGTSLTLLAQHPKAGTATVSVRLD